jgi:hypothetical protein
LRHFCFYCCFLSRNLFLKSKKLASTPTTGFTKRRGKGKEERSKREEGYQSLCCQAFLKKFCTGRVNVREEGGQNAVIQKKRGKRIKVAWIGR